MSKAFDFEVLQMRYIKAGRNSRGEGPASDVATVEVGPVLATARYKTASFFADRLAIVARESVTSKPDRNRTTRAPAVASSRSIARVPTVRARSPRPAGRRNSTRRQLSDR